MFTFKTIIPAAFFTLLMAATLVGADRYDFFICANVNRDYVIGSRIDGRFVDYSKWKLFEGPYLNANLGERVLTLTHGNLERVLDLNTFTITDRVR